TYRYGAHRDLPPFPTRRSSDLSGKVSGSFTLASASAQTALVLTDAAGAQHRIELGTRAPGDVAFQVDPAKLGLPAGSYGLSVERSEEHTSELQSRENLVCRLLL